MHDVHREALSVPPSSADRVARAARHWLGKGPSGVAPPTTVAPCVPEEMRIPSRRASSTPPSGQALRLLEGVGQACVRYEIEKRTSRQITPARYRSVMAQRNGIHCMGEWWGDESATCAANALSLWRGRTRIHRALAEAITRGGQTPIPSHFRLTFDFIAEYSIPRL